MDILHYLEFGIITNNTAVYIVEHILAILYKPIVQ